METRNQEKYRAFPIMDNSLNTNGIRILLSGFAETILALSLRNRWVEGKMKVKFTLAMDDLLVSGKHYDQVVLDWEDEIEEEEVLALSQSWIGSQNFLVQRMNGLARVGESSLTIEPMEAPKSPKGKRNAGLGINF